MPRRDTDAPTVASGTARTVAVARAPASAPMVLGRYALGARLGSGAFGSVWRARDERLERDVAVKILARDRVTGGRFEREARAAARLSHPAIVTLYEAAVDDEGAYLVSELVRGVTLGRLLDEGRLSDRDIVEVAIALCDALEHAHGHGVVHRDIKPSNVLVPERQNGAGPAAKLTDFGVASVAGGGSLTRTGDVLGTLAYMAPEQAAGIQAGPAADLYSLALVIYEALTGVNPLAGASGSTSQRRRGMRPAPLRRQRRDLPADLGYAIDRALASAPRDRGSVADLRDALGAARPRLCDEPGVVADPWTTLVRRGRAVESPRAQPFAATDVTATRRAGRLGRSDDPGADPGVDPGHGPGLRRSLPPPSA
ncbi:MAG: serine/threonine-protein kinase, partial [Solirubrobacteraceae bacterium]